jgi:hypothetical protein
MDSISPRHRRKGVFETLPSTIRNLSDNPNKSGTEKASARNSPSTIPISHIPSWLDMRQEIVDVTFVCGAELSTKIAYHHDIPRNFALR